MEPRCSPLALIASPPNRRLYCFPLWAASRAAVVQGGPKSIFIFRLAGGFLGNKPASSFEEPIMSAVAPLPVSNEEALDPVVLRAGLEACGEGLALAAGGRVLYANQAFAEALGFNHGAEIHGRALTDLLLQDQNMDGLQKRCIGVVRDSEAAGCETADLGHPRRAPHHEDPALLLETTSTVFQARGREWQILSARRAQDGSLPPPAAQRMEAVGRLVSGVAHDFNNLLTGVLLYCDLLHANLERAPQLVRHVDEMRAAAQRGATLIRQLLELARQQPSPPGLLSWNEAVRGLADFLRRLIGENVVLATDLAAGLAPVRMDPAEMQQVILNLVLNARDAMPEGGRITVATRNSRFQPENGEPEGRAMVEFSVTDTGRGMDDATRAQVFHPFFTTKPAGQGSGIGLATVHGIVLRQKGTVRVESAPGKGTRVLVCLPQGSTGNFDSDPAILRGNSL